MGKNRSGSHCSFSLMLFPTHCCCHLQQASESGQNYSRHSTWRHGFVTVPMPQAIPATQHLHLSASSCLHDKLGPHLGMNTQKSHRTELRTTPCRTSRSALHCGTLHCAALRHGTQTLSAALHCSRLSAATYTGSDCSHCHLSRVRTNTTWPSHWHVCCHAHHSNQVQLSDPERAHNTPHHTRSHALHCT